jgi:hypothetical protein
MTKVQGWIVIALLCAICSNLEKEIMAEMGMLALAIGAIGYAFVELRRGV